MQKFAAMIVAVACSSILSGQEPAPVRPKAGKVQIFKEADLKPGMKGYAWTVLSGSTPEPIPVEILGIYKNQWGPKQDVILAKMGGKAQRINVAAGMSGSPVYIDGKLVGAVALRFSTFSPDAICGITPIELMLEVNEFDDSRPSDARTPDKATSREVASAMPGDLAFAPIDTPLNFAGFGDSVLREFAPAFQQMGVAVAGGGAASTLSSAKPAPGWQQSLQPGDAVSGILVTGDMSVSAMCTVTYNDEKHVLFCGHSFFNLGPIDMPMAKADVITTLASQYQPTKFGNATEIVGALRQDRHSGVMGELGATAGMVPVTLHVRSFGDSNTVRKERELKFSVFVQQKWTPYLMMLTLFNSVSGLNEFMEEATYRLSGTVDLDGGASLSLNTMQASGEMPMPAPMLLAGWWGDKFNRLYLNAVKTPRLKRVSVTVDLLPERRVATIENAWIADSDVRPGSDAAVKVFLRPYRGDRIERNFKVHVPEGLSKGEHRILLSDADILNHMQNMAGYMSRYMDLPETVSLINQERSNNKLYISLLESTPTAYYDDKTMPSLPASVLNVMQAGRTSNRPMVTTAESALEQASVPFDYVISGSYSLKITVK